MSMTIPSRGMRDCERESMKSLPLQFLGPWLVPLLDVKEGSWIETTTWENQLSSCRTQEAGIQYS